jgi:hypothetical protein
VVSEELDGSSWEEFKQDSTRVAADGSTYFIVEWDIPIATESELRSYFENMVAGKMSKSAVRLTPNSGSDTGQCNVNPPPSNCVDDRFSANEQLNLKYCVSTAFGINQGAMVAAMAVAADAWHQVANVSFTYVSTNDSACSQTDNLPASVDFKVAPWTGAGACSYWPRSGVNCVPKTLVFNTSYNFSPMTTTGALTHELGHILGLHHEHSRADAAIPMCTAYEMRYLTAYDSSSIMGYPAVWGGCSIGGGNVLTVSDGIGIRSLYGMPAAWYVPIFGG